MRVRMAEEKDIERIHSLLAQVALVHHKGRPDLFKYGKSKVHGRRAERDPAR